MNSKLKIGLLLDPYRVPIWASKIIGTIDRSDYAKIVLIVVDGVKDFNRKYNIDSILYKTNACFDKTVNQYLDISMKKESNDPLACIDLSADLVKYGWVCLNRSKDSTINISDEVVRELNERDLDVLIDINNVTPLNELSFFSRYGVLSFSSGDGGMYNGSQPGFWEIFNGSPCTNSHIRWTQNGKTKAIYKSYSQTIFWSEKRNREQIYHKGSSFIPRVLKQLYLNGDKASFLDTNSSIPIGNNPVHPGPGNLDMIRYFARLIPKDASFITRRVLLEGDWTIRYKLGNHILTAFDGFTTLTPPPHTWWGDPHVIQKEGYFYIFIEELLLPRKKNNGHISVIKVDSQGRYEHPVKVLERPYHISYPFVFQWMGSFYMVPESSNAHTIELYEAEEFPYKWRHVKNLMTNVIGVDTTLFRMNDLWWMFCNMVEADDAPIDDELFLFYADDLFTNHWEPHPQNPIVSDVRRARPAGGVFQYDGNIYRPSQDSSNCYGYAVNLNKIEVMDEHQYEEINSLYIEPKEFTDASRVHTFSHISGITVVDTYHTRPRLFSGVKEY